MILYLYSFNLCVGINENYKYFMAALIYNNIDSGHPQWTSLVLTLKGLDKDTIYFDFRLDVRITNFNDMDGFLSVNKHMKGRESKIPIHPVRKNSQKWQLSVCWVY